MEEFLELVIKNVEIMTQHIVKVTFVRPVRPNFKSLLRFLIHFLQRQYVVMLFYSLGVGNSALFHNPARNTLVIEISAKGCVIGTF